MEFYSVIKRNEALTRAMTQMNLENIIPPGKGQRLKDIVCESTCIKCSAQANPCSCEVGQRLPGAGGAGREVGSDG